MGGYLLNQEQLEKLAVSLAEPIPKVSPGRPKRYGRNNNVFSAEVAAKALALLKSKLGISTPA